VIAIIMAEGNPDPVLVAKMPRLASFSESIRREAESLVAIQRSRLGGFDFIPRVVAFEEYRGLPILVETALIGKPMDPTAIRRGVASCCDALTSWLIGMRHSQPSLPRSDALWFERLAEGPLQQFAGQFPLSPNELRLLERTKELIAPLKGRSLSPVFEHGDLSHPNILLLKNGGVGIVDWELAEPNGLPTYDLFFFLTYVAMAVSRARANRAFVSAFHGAFFSRAAWARAYVRSYAERLQLPAYLLTPLFILCWARYTANLHNRVCRIEDRQGPTKADAAAWLRTNRYYLFWQYAVANINKLDWSDVPKANATRG
jgi:hypothetical protein